MQFEFGCDVEICIVQEWSQISRTRYLGGDIRWYPSSSTFPSGLQVGVNLEETPN